MGFPPALAPRAAGDGEASACGVQGFRTRPGCAKLTRQSDFPARHAPVAGDARQPGRPDATGDGHGAVTARATQPGTTQSPCPVLSHAARHTHAVSPCRTSPTHARPTRPAGPVTWHTLSPRLCVIPAHARPVAGSSRAVPPGFIPLHPFAVGCSPPLPFLQNPFFFFFPLCLSSQAEAAPWWEEGWEGVNHLSPPLPPWPTAVPAAGRTPGPFSPPPGLLQVLLDPARHHQAALHRGKAAEKAGARPSSPTRPLRTAPKRKKKPHPHTTWDTRRGTGGGTPGAMPPRCTEHNGGFRGVCGALQPLPTPRSKGVTAARPQGIKSVG